MAMSLYFYLSLICAIFKNVTTESGTITQNIEDDDHKNFDFLLVNGLKVKKYEFQTIVSLRTSECIEYWGDNHFCTGAIVSSKTVITAAHCVVNRQGVRMQAKKIRVVAGLINRLDKPLKGNDIGVKSIAIYPGYKRYLNNDIALLRLKSPVLRMFIMHNTKIGKMVDKLENCAAIGWGQLYPNGPYANELFYTTVVIVSPEECLNKNQTFSNQTQLCAAPDDEEADLCWGDTGAPLICNRQLVGIFGGNTKCSGHRILKFTNVMYYVDWINRIKCGKHKADLEPTGFASIVIGILLALFLIFLTFCNIY